MFEVVAPAVEDFPGLFEPGRIGSVRTKNRIVMAPMGTSLAAKSGEVTAGMVEHYRRRAAGGAGLLVVEFTCVDYPQGKGHPSQLSLHDDSLLAGHANLAEAIHAAGAKAFVQLHHAGAAASPQHTGGVVAVAPSPVPGRPEEQQPHVLSRGEIQRLVEQFARAVERAWLAGYDGVELHGAHGYLMAEFMSPFTNTRDDEYGGSLAGRMRFVLEVIARARELTGADFPLTVRVSGEEHLAGGQTIADTVTGVRLLEEAGVAGVHVSAGGETDPEWIVDPMSHPQGVKVHLAAAVKQAVSIPVITVGVIRDPEFAERVLRTGKADFVALGRALIADPDWPLKSRQGRVSEISRCFSCNECLRRVNMGLSIRCTMNPDVGSPSWLIQRTTTRRPRTVMVVGGGPAGMEAARVAASRGHRVTLHERADKLGGQLLIGRNLRDKAKISWLLGDLERKLASSAAEVVLDSEVTAETVDTADPDVVIVACGGQPARPAIPGVSDPRVSTAWKIYSGDAGSVPPEGVVVVVGGNSTGCEVALDMASRGATVALVEQRADLAIDMESITRTALHKTIETQEGLTVHCNRRVLRIEREGVVIVDSDNRSTILPADRIVIAVGTVSSNELLHKLSAQSRELYVIGDCSQPSTIFAAVSDGRTVGCLV